MKKIPIIKNLDSSDIKNTRGSLELSDSFSAELFDIIKAFKNEGSVLPKISLWYGVSDEGIILCDLVLDAAESKK